MKTTYKYIFALVALLALIPTASRAQVDNDGVVTSKTVSPEFSSDGKYTLTLETYALGKEITTTTTKVVSTDIELVLDVSGSMYEDPTGIFGTVSSSYSDRFIKVAPKGDFDTLDKVKGQTAGYYWVNYDGLWDTYYQVRYNASSERWQYRPALGAGLVWVNLSTVSGLSFESIYIQKLDAMKTAVTEFIDAVKKNGDDNGVTHRIGIVTFASTASEKTALTEVTAASATTLKTTVNGLSARGATRADLGMQKAEAQMQASYNSKPDNVRVTILFTDGEPTSGSNFENAVANGTISSAYNIKNNYGGSVFALGTFSESDKSKTNVNTYMNYVSSNYPKATNMTTPGGNQVASSYYKLADTGVDISNVFKEIAETAISGGSYTTLSTNSVVKDYITPEFKLPDGAVTTDIKIYKAKCTAVGSDDLPSAWATKELITQSSTGVHATINDNLVSVTGFDFTSDENWCGSHSGVAGGYKLIIEIPIIAKDNAVGGTDIPTNEEESGVYPDEDATDPIENYDIPVVDLPLLLTIKKNGLSAGDNAVFTIEKTASTGTSSESFEKQTIIITGLGTTTPVTATIKVLPGKYKVTETSWAEGYTPDHTVVEKVVDSEDPEVAVFEFTNTTNSSPDIPIEAEAVATNVWNVEATTVTRKTN